MICCLKIHLLNNLVAIGTINLKKPWEFIFLRSFCFISIYRRRKKECSTISTYTTHAFRNCKILHSSFSASVLHESNWIFQLSVHQCYRSFACFLNTALISRRGRVILTERSNTYISTREYLHSPRSPINELQFRIHQYPVTTDHRRRTFPSINIPQRTPFRNLKRNTSRADGRESTHVYLYTHSRSVAPVARLRRRCAP